MSRIKTTFSLFTVTSLLAFLPLNGADTVTSILGKWDNAVGTQANFGLTGQGTNTIFWGTPAGSDGKSGYQFTASNTPLNVVLDTPFALGTFTHFNNPILSSGGSLTSVDLLIKTSLNIGGTAVGPIDFSFLFNHNETPNSGPGNCCNDIVTFTNDSLNIVFNVGGVNYTMGLVGFKTSPNGPLLNQFSTIEGQDNSAQLYAQISRPSVFVPEPETYLLMGAFVALGIVLAHKRRKGTTTC